MNSLPGERRLRSSSACSLDAPKEPQRVRTWVHIHERNALTDDRLPCPDWYVQDLTAIERALLANWRIRKNPTTRPY